ncbi:MAG TPA: hypothetical protein V6D34_06780 [Candidatus Sericytochromatia bacterium]
MRPASSIKMAGSTAFAKIGHFQQNWMCLVAVWGQRLINVKV